MKSKGDKKEEIVSVPVLVPTLTNTVEDESNLIIMQRIVEAPFQVSKQKRVV